ncbi:hypothetical protein K491DRAFT_663842 [Lophiostoma macrostomum CBS 122681]|uniref:Rhodopsin domain-containing protein n=1 Tax=Lophiostoma macrostomum CBS 122681 TaxID=1314788 RepID=A0A6A6SZC1_9PLEO|nr:hypothetical protein K491DRAFT_663842 [Lophiostoma macrostomum CBS 122681]
MALTHAGAQVVIVISLFAAITSLFVGLRLWTRFVLIRAPGYEDTVLIFSWLCFVATVILIGLQVHFGLGTHGDALSESQVQNLQLCIYINISTYCASIGLTKIAILIQYQRVFPTPKFQIWCWSFIAIILAYTIATVAACIFVCTPIPKFWMGGEGKCIDTFASWFANAAINIVTDLMIIILPMPVVRSLKLARKQKYLLMGVFAFGTIVCIISIVRLHSLLIITTSEDQSFDNAPVAQFSVVEMGVALICACLPTLRPLLSKYISGLGHSSRGTHSSNINISLGGRKSGMPSVGAYNMQLSTLGPKRGVERLESEAGDEDDKIRVVTRVDIKVSGTDGQGPDTRESSTESLFRNARNDGHVV